MRFCVRGRIAGSRPDLRKRDRRPRKEVDRAEEGDFVYEDAQSLQKHNPRGDSTYRRIAGGAQPIPRSGDHASKPKTVASIGQL